MKLWQSLYAMIWLAFLEILIVLDPIQDIKYSLFIHLFLGIGIVILAIYNKKKLYETDCPDRVKRIAGVILTMSIIAGITGILIRWDPMDLGRLLHFLHVVVSLAIMAQSASCATGYDMWEEKEFSGKVGPPKPLEPPQP
ncbi:MAG: hypothetical protein KAS16_01610 [Thermoplasmata archaeon]|nr:hypothetical protein [Thermoplasmata archaeon]